MSNLKPSMRKGWERNGSSEGETRKHCWDAASPGCSSSARPVPPHGSSEKGFPHAPARLSGSSRNAQTTRRLWDAGRAGKLQPSPPVPGDCPRCYLGDVLLADHMLSVPDLLWIVCYEDASALAAALWLADECSPLRRASVSLEVSIAGQGAGEGRVAVSSCHTLPVSSLLTAVYSNDGATEENRPCFCSRGTAHLFLSSLTDKKVLMQPDKAL